MTATTPNILSKRFRFASIVMLFVLIIYVGFSFFLFFQWVSPSLDGRVQQHIAADSGTYLYFAQSLRRGEMDPYVIASLASFPNTLWAPVLLAYILQSTFAMVLANYAAFILSIILLKKSFSFSMSVFVGLMLLNATTTISLLSVNKEIIDLLVISLFFFARQTNRRWALVLALLLALFNRFEVCLVMLLFLFAVSKLNPLRQKRFITTVLLVLIFSVMLPLAASKSLSDRFEEASEGTTITTLDTLEMNYLYGVAVLPKIAENFFGELVNVSKWEHSYNLDDLANSYILLSNNLATAIVLVVLVKKRRLTLQSDILYFAVIGCIIMAISLVIQPRYFYFAYSLFCLQAALFQKAKPVRFAFSTISPPEIEHA